MSKRRRAQSHDSTFNAIQEFIYLYKKAKKQKIKAGDYRELTLEEFVEWLIGEGWSFDFNRYEE